MPSHARTSTSQAASRQRPPDDAHELRVLATGAVAAVGARWRDVGREARYLLSLLHYLLMSDHDPESTARWSERPNGRAATSRARAKGTGPSA